MTRGPRHAVRYALAALLASAAWSIAVPAAAQMLNRHGPRAERGFGNRDAFVFSVENVLGIERSDFGQLSIDSTPMHPVYWGNIGLFSVDKSGLTLGAVVGATHIFVPKNSSYSVSDGTDLTLLRFQPRIGYAGSQTRTFGFWLRGGPSLLTEFSGNSSAYILAVGGEAYAVITPVPHFGILLGPNVDVYVYGRTDNGDQAKLTEYGLTSGLFGEFW